MIKLKDLLFEKVAHSKKSLEWVSMDFIPMTPKTMKQILGDTPINAFHNVDWLSAKKQIPNIIGKKKSISTYTGDTSNRLSLGGGVQTMGGIVLQVQGKVLVAGTEDLGSVPDEAGRRWLHPNTFGKIVGMKHFEKGDRSDGIPNILSDDNVFVEGRRQKPLSKKKLNNWVNDIFFYTHFTEEENKNYNRNRKLIDLNCIPQKIEDKINNEFNDVKVATRDKILGYFINKKLKTLIEVIDEF